MFYGWWNMSKIIHQTDLKCKWYDSDAASLTKIKTVSFISHRSFKSNQIKLIEMKWIDVKKHVFFTKIIPWIAVWVLMQQRPCRKVSGHIWSFLRFGVERRCSNTVAKPKSFKGSFWYVPVILHNAGFWHLLTIQPLPLICEERSRKSLNDSGACAGLDDWTSFTRDAKLIRSGPFILNSKIQFQINR